ncbi:class I adenylate-forming enzyme family protein [Phenylobacterium sp. VNQ135]|uniref:class I adenylate-forming enzyme family protein n=1 Tax=Phenylobacterium sp. VNQ135 TaxID=3400922 RepID=UPI003C00990B
MFPIDCMYRGALVAPDAIAVETEAGDRALTHRELAGAVDALAAYIQDRIPAAQSRIAVCGHNTVEHLIAILAIYASGNTWVALNPRNARPELDRLVLASRAGLIIADEDCLDRFDTSLAPVLVGASEGRAQGNLAAVIHANLGRRPSARPITLQDVQAIKFTGGSTGIPKGVMQSYRAGATAIANLQFAYGYDRSEVNLVAAPVSHAAGVYVLPILAVGGRHILLRTPAAGAILDAFERRGVTRCFLPPTVIYNLLEDSSAAARSYPSLRAISYGAAPMPMPRIRHAQAVFGPRIDAAYGQVEAPQTIALATADELARDDLAGSVGRPGRMNRVSIRTADGLPAGPGEIGEICVAGDLLMNGYLDAPDLTEQVLRDGWLSTGDLGFLDQGGRLFIRGRSKEMLISGGFNVYPVDVENALASHPAVAECVVFGVSDEKWGERVEAAVVLKPNLSASSEELIAAAKARVGSVQAPKFVHLVPSLPRNAVGKLVRREIAAALTGAPGS